MNKSDILCVLYYIFYIGSTLLGYFTFYNFSIQNYYYIPLFSYFAYHVGLLGHEACHGALPHIFKYLMDIEGAAHVGWIFKHNKHHHTHTNEIGKDMDIYYSSQNSFPMITIFGNKLCYIQYFLFPFQSISIKYYCTNYAIKNNEQSIVLLAPLYTYIIYPIYQNGFLSGMAFTVMTHCIVGFMYGIVFSVSHMNMQAEINPEGSFYEKQLKTTVTWKPQSYLWNYLTGGLNHQIEHHLNPKIPSFYYPSLKPDIVKKYKMYKQEDSLWDAIKSNFRFIKLKTSR